MARIDDYRKFIQQILEKYAAYKPAYNDVSLEIIRDAENDHYQLMFVGWNGQERIYGCIFHFDIKNGKIWIQHNGTEVEIADEFVKMGVPKSDIVLAFHAPSKRPYTEFATS
jgi:hypothetical protein